jgi:tripartite-type tricarboxylate transporter receptor subunit TctC
VKYVHDAAKAVVDSQEFAKTMDSRGVDVDDRDGEVLKAALWKEYRLNTEILRRIGLVK